MSRGKHQCDSSATDILRYDSVQALLVIPNETEDTAKRAIGVEERSAMRYIVISSN